VPVRFTELALATAKASQLTWRIAPCVGLHSAAVNPTASPATARRRWADSPTLSRLFIPAAVNLAAEAPGAPAAAPSP